MPPARITISTKKPALINSVALTLLASSARKTPLAAESTISSSATLDTACSSAIVLSFYHDHEHSADHHRTSRAAVWRGSPLQPSHVARPEAVPLGSPEAPSYPILSRLSSTS